MSTFTDRIRARTRRTNAKRAKQLAARLGQRLAPPVTEFAPEAPLEQEPTREVVFTDADEPAVVTIPDDVQDKANENLLRHILENEPEGDEALSQEMPASAPDQLDAVVDAAADDSLLRVEFSRSSNIVSAELDADGIVTVLFRSGDVYRYANFTLELLADWEAAKSAGSWFHNNVRTKPDRHPVVQ